MLKRRLLGLGCSLALLALTAAPATANTVAAGAATVPVVQVADGSDVPPPAAGMVLDPNSLYVYWVYADLFGRAPDAAGLETWAGLLDSGTPRVAVANAITSSEEFRSGLIADSYDWYLARTPDAGGLGYWLSMMASGWTISQMESGFIASDEYYARAGGTPSAWVEALYADVLERSASPAEIDYWTGRLAAGASRGAVAMGFLLSTEHLSSVVDGYYQWLLGRGLDASGKAYWVGQLQAGGRDEVIIGGIVSSDEYWAWTQAG
ncbi:MAG: DUF4214 domain-containing protein [Cellulomonadaceae bacterium]|nr:DUF4214 domain-containing protein [Cellulomonadaceae bacterium]